MKNIVKVGAVLATTLLASAAFAQEGTTTSTGMSSVALAYLGAYLGLGLAALGGALGQSKVAAAALEGIARNPQASDKIFTPLILSLAFIESLVIYALVVALIKT